jgi:hypothetical protein
VTTPDDKCTRARDFAGRWAAGAAVAQEDLEWAVEHLASCERCWEEFDLPDAEASVRDLPVKELRVDPVELFERALTTAISDPEAIVRRRAAERLGAFERLGIEALAALVTAASDDPDGEVRAEALRAIDRLDTAVSVPERLIEAWAEAPAQAAPFLSAALERLSGTIGGVVAAGEAGVTGRLEAQGNELRLTVAGLPASFENTWPVVMLPKAFEPEAPAIEWAGERPGVVRADESVADGSVNILLGSFVKEPVAEKLAERVYVLNPAARRRRV